MGFLDSFARWSLNNGLSLYDKNDDGLLTKDELGSGTIEYRESVMGHVQKRTILNSETFDSFDTDKNGSIDKKELYKGFDVKEGKALSTGAIIAIAVACVAVVGIIIGLVAYFSNRHNKKRKEAEKKFYEMQQKNNNNESADLNLQSNAKTQQIS